MGSWARSSLESGARRALLLGAGRLAVHHWHRGQPVECFELGSDEDALALFDRYLASSAQVRTWVLFDLVEEEFRLERLPRLSRGDRRDLLARRLARAFEGAAWVRAQSQGQEPGAEAGERVLMSALTDDAALRPWLELLERHAVPLAGLCSLPLLGERLVRRLRPAARQVVLLSLQSVSGLRQSCFRDGRLVASRLAVLPRQGEPGCAAALLEELERFERYLREAGLAGEGGDAESLVLAGGGLLDRLRALAGGRLRLLELAQAGRSLGLRAPPLEACADALYLRLMLEGAGVDHYGRPADLRRARLQRLGEGTLAVSLALLLGSAGAGGWLLAEGAELRVRALEAAAQARAQERRLAQTLESSPSAGPEAAEVRELIEAARRLVAYRSSPRAALLLLGRVLEAHPRVRLERLEWRGRQADTPAVEWLRLSGRLQPLEGDLRAASENLERLAAALRAQPGVVGVELERLPFAAAEGLLRGEFGGGRPPAEADFTLRVLLEAARAEG